jgi:hypothetical protein
MNKNCLDLDLNKPTSISIFLSKIDDTWHELCVTLYYGSDFTEYG